MARISMCFLFCVFCFMSSAFSQNTEEITFTTYYPSPYGSYVEMHANKIAVGSGYQGTVPPDNSLIVQGSVNIGTASPIGNSRLTVAGDSTLNGSTAVNGTFMVNGVKGAGMYFDVPWANLNAAHPGCTGVVSHPQNVTDCMAACNRVCLGNNYHGGAIVEWSGGVAGRCICS
ncbi:MAG: hypothetical protein NT088_04520 [Candidatus Omnitrophica bacterium]|nr:hypothetical protein [Candidatus Omnitrophota bacterium]